MDEDQRYNQGYEIIESITVRGKELVIGYDPEAALPYVCWYHIDDAGYLFGYYTSELSNAKEKLEERYLQECMFAYKNWI